MARGLIFRLAVLGALACAAAAGSAVAASRNPTHVTLPPVARVAHRTCVRIDPEIDARIAKRIAPSTTVHLDAPPRATAKLARRGYVFPLLGPYPPFTDTFDVPRADTGWHHGDDLFAPRGAPVLAVTDGVVFSVGWNRIGGWRLWLVDRFGNLFYYAHLERYSRLAVDGRRVQAGEVLGFVGTSGDARNTPPHLFFELNPASLRHLGYDGTVDPTPYLRTWSELRSPRRAPRTTPSQRERCTDAR